MIGGCSIKKGEISICYTANERYYFSLSTDVLNMRMIVKVENGSRKIIF